MLWFLRSGSVGDVADVDDVLSRRNEGSARGRSWQRGWWSGVLTADSVESGSHVDTRATARDHSTAASSCVRDGGSDPRTRDDALDRLEQKVGNPLRGSRLRAPRQPGGKERGKSEKGNRKSGIIDYSLLYTRSLLPFASPSSLTHTLLASSLKRRHEGKKHTSPEEAKAIAGCPEGADRAVLVSRSSCCPGRATSGRPGVADVGPPPDPSSGFAGKTSASDSCSGPEGPGFGWLRDSGSSTSGFGFGCPGMGRGIGPPPPPGMPGIPGGTIPGKPGRGAPLGGSHGCWGGI